MMSNFFNNPYYQTNPNLNVPSTDITIPKVTNNSLGLRQIEHIEGINLETIMKDVVKE